MFGQSILFLMLCYRFIDPIGEVSRDCTPATTKEGIEISRCNRVGSDYQAVLVKFESEGRLEDYLKLARDVPNFVNWHYRIDQVEVLKVINDSTIIYRSEIDTPWPLDTREMIVRVDVVRFSAGASVKMVSIPDFISEKEGFLRIPFSSTEMLVTERGANRLHFEYYAEVEPGGSIPAWIVNMFSLNGPYQTFKNLKALLAESMATE